MDVISLERVPAQIAAALERVPAQTALALDHVAAQMALALERAPELAELVAPLAAAASTFVVVVVAAFVVRKWAARRSKAGEVREDVPLSSLGGLDVPFAEEEFVVPAEEPTVAEEPVVVETPPVVVETPPVVVEAPPVVETPAEEVPEAPIQEVSTEPTESEAVPENAVAESVVAEPEIVAEPEPIREPEPEKPKPKEARLHEAVLERTAAYAVQGGRPVMADSHLVAALDASGDVAVAAVFDGCGGSRASAFASKKVGALLAAEPGMDLADALRETEAAMLKAAARGKWPDATTAVAARVDWRTKSLEVAWVGDSRCIVGRRSPQGAFVADVVTRDHNASDKAEEKRVKLAGGRVGRSEAEAKAGTSKKFLGKIVGAELVFHHNNNNPKRVYPGGITLTRALGALPLKNATPQLVIADPEAIHRRTLDDRDAFLILASDGVFESLTPQRAVDLVADVLREQPPRAALDLAAQTLVSTAQVEGSTDNTTCVLLSLS